MAKRDTAESARIKEIEKKLLANPEMVKLIDEIATTAVDANELVRGMLQTSLSRVLQA